MNPDETVRVPALVVEALARALERTAMNPLPESWFRDHAQRIAAAYAEEVTR